MDMIGELMLIRSLLERRHLNPFVSEPPHIKPPVRPLKPSACC